MISEATLFLAGIIVAIVGHWAKGVVETLGKRADKHSAIAEAVASQSARIKAMEDTTSKLASADEKLVEAVERLTRLEEWRLGAEPRLSHADETSRTVIAIHEQMRTAFKRIDSIDERMSEMPRQTAELILRGLKPEYGVITGGRHG